MPKPQRILLILASSDQESKKDKLIVDLCEEFGEVCQAQDLQVDWIDLYDDYHKKEFDPFGSGFQKDAKIVEYQFRIRRADVVAFFHPVKWNGVPAILKGFLDQALAPGFAYKSTKDGPEGLLKEKFGLVYAFSDTFEWQNRLFYNNTLEVFWRRGIFDVCEIKSQFYSLSGLRNFGEKKIAKTRDKVLRSAKLLGSKDKDNLLDLF